MNELLRIRLLRVVLNADGAVLVVLGLLLMFATGLIFAIFKMPELTDTVRYVTGMWGALMATMGIGYFLAARNPRYSTIWVIVGIFRAILEAVISIFDVLTGAVSFQNAWLAVVLAAWFALAYLVLYPYPRRAQKNPDKLEAANG
jgi:hypothetical protein